MDSLDAFDTLHTSSTADSSNNSDVMNPIQLVTATNDKYAKHLGVMLTSLLKNIDKKSEIQIYIIDGGISEKNQSNLKQVVKKNICS
ncbi:glycosyltransferase [Paenibacillus aestuarii]|uniref:Glycosyltransferase n=1 Tax=Paenibacillus aestuarii TaxID=516965 RepID=A0ABW0K1T9_9BACL|nr:glycosyltransferase [Paenibacillus aestuarii]